MPQSQEAPKLRIRPLIVIFALAFLCAVLLYFSPQSQPPKIIAPVKAASYVWPDGCERKNYDKWDKISQNCKDKRYLLTWEFATNMGMTGAKVRGSLIKYYRVGNDAISVNCWRMPCEVELIYKDIFYQEK